MRNDPLHEGLRWHRQSLEDHKWATALCGQGGGYHIVCFLCQQIGEKSLKAFLYAQGEELVLGHSNLKLAQKAASFDKTFSGEISSWAALDNYYIAARYPNGIPDGIPAETFNKEMAENALAIAAKIIEFVCRKAGFPG